MIDNLKYIYSLEIITPIGVIKKEIFADAFKINRGIYIFVSEIDWEKIIASFPLDKTMIVSVNENVNYVKQENSINDINYIHGAFYDGEF